MLTKEQARKLVDRMEALTRRDLARGAGESQEFAALRAKLFAGGWVMLAEKCERLKNGRYSFRLRLAKPDDPEWINLPCE